MITRRQKIANLFGISLDMAHRVELYCEGLTDVTIAQRLNISKATVKTYFLRLRQDHDLKNKYELMMYVANHLKGNNETTLSP
jgi:DNA-binding CsgD family transcriptional regulator